MSAPNIHRIWGSHRILEDCSDYKIKELVLGPGSSLPIKQYNMNKQWIILRGACVIQTVYLENPETIVLAQGNNYVIGAGVSHMAMNKTDKDCCILEIRYAPG